jgi:hypothetical protein
MSDEDVSVVLDLFRDGVIIGIFSVVKMIEGADFPAASALLLCTSFAPSKSDETVPNSRNRYVQMIGRVRRTYREDDEKYALIHDHGENYLKYGHPDNIEIGFDTLDDGKKKPESEAPAERKKKPVVCPECNHYIDRGNTCGMCGYVLEKYTEIVDGEVVEFVNGKMIDVEDDIIKVMKKANKKDTPEQKEHFYGGLKSYAISRSYKPGWASHAYKQKYGVWPNKYKHCELRKVSKEVKDWVIYLRLNNAKNRSK